MYFSTLQPASSIARVSGVTISGLFTFFNQKGYMYSGWFGLNLVEVEGGRGRLAR